MGVEVSPGNCVFRRVVAKHGPTGDACGSRDVVDAHVRESTVGEQPQGDVCDVLRGGGTAAADPWLLRHATRPSIPALDAIF